MSAARHHAITSLARDARGVVMLEFLIAFVPTFVFFLAVFQLILIAVSSLVVQHAAVVGARAAAVVLDDDPQRYDGVARGVIRGESQGNTEYTQRLGKRLGATANPSERGADQPAPGGPRLAAIRTAVHLRLSAIAPEPSVVRALIKPAQSVRGAIGESPLSRLWFGLGIYTGASTAITFPTAPNADKVFEDRVDAKDLITVRVSHLMLCLVPIASAFICDRPKLSSRGELDLRTSDAPGKRALQELRKAQSSSEQWLFVAAGVPVKLLHAEATMAAVAAPYLYQSEQSSSKGRAK